jgi:hypothetical protein
MFTQQPTNTAAGSSIAPAVTVSVEDAAGNVVTGSTAAVNVAVGTNPGSGTLSGTATENAVSGVATFSNLSINKTGTGYTLTASSSPLTGATSSTFNIVTGSPASITVVSGSGQSATQGAAFANSLVALVTDASGNPVDDATVTFTAPSSGASGTFAASGCTNNSPTTTCVVTTGSNGEATASTFTANNTGGVYYTVTASVTDVIATAGFIDMLNGGNFTITGPAGLAPLHPGTTESLDVSIYNPNPEAITVPLDSITGAVSTIGNGDANGSLTACQTGWFAIPASPSAASVIIPAGATESLSDLSVSSSDWPVLSMTDTVTNQDNCANATLNLTFNGTASGS